MSRGNGLRLVSLRVECLEDRRLLSANGVVDISVPEAVDFASIVRKRKGDITDMEEQKSDVPFSSSRS